MNPLTDKQLTALGILVVYGPCTPATVAEKLEWRSSDAMRVMDALVRKGRVTILQEAWGEVYAVILNNYLHNRRKEADGRHTAATQDKGRATGPDAEQRGPGAV